MTKLWVVARDNYGEGYALPIVAFVTEEEAELYAEHMEKGPACYAVAEVQLMRFTPAQVEPAAE